MSQQAFWGIVILCHLFGAAWNLSKGPWILEDSKEYLSAGVNLAEHQLLYASDWEDSEHLDDYTKRPPVYPFLLILTGAIRGNLIFLTLIQTFFSLASIWLVSRWIKTDMQAEVPWALWGVAILLTPGQWMYPSLVMTEILFQLILVSLGISMVRAIRRDGIGWWFLASLLIIVGFLTKPVLYLFSMVWGLIGIIAGWKKRSLSVVFVSFLPLLAVIGYMSWNEARTGHFHVSSIQNLSLLQYTTTNLLVDAYGAEEGFAKADSILYLSLSQETYKAEQVQLQQSCVEVILDHLPAYIWMHARGMANFFLDPGRFDVWSFFQVEDKGTGLLAVFSESGYAGVMNALLSKPLGWVFFLLAILLMNLLKVVGIFLFLVRHRTKLFAGIVALLLLYLSGLTGTSGAARFALPIFPFLLIGLTSFRRKGASSKNQA